MFLIFQNDNLRNWFCGVLQDYKKILYLALPVIMGNAIDTIMMMIDRLFLSQVATEEGSEIMLAGAMGGGVITWLVQAPVMGLLMYTNAMSAQNFGRKDLPKCAQVTSQALYWAIAYYPFMLLFSQFIPSILNWMGHAPALVGAEWQYSKVMIIGAIFALLRIPLNSFFIASNRSKLVMKVSFVGVAVNIPLDYWLIFDSPLSLGSWSLRPSDLGIVAGINGAAMATVFAQLLTCALLLILFLQQQSEYCVRDAWCFRPRVHSELLRFGLPASLEGFFASFAFNISLMLFNSISPLVAAAGTITFSWDMCNFIVLQGVGTATTTLIGQSLGTRNVAQAKRYTRLILCGTLVFSGFTSLWFLFAPDLLSSVFITEETSDPEALLQLSRTLLRFAAFYLLTDALGVVMRSALIAAGDTLAVMVISNSMYMVLLSGSILLLKVLHWDAVKLWGFFIAFILVINGLFTFRYASDRWTKCWQD